MLKIAARLCLRSCDGRRIVPGFNDMELAKEGPSDIEHFPRLITDIFDPAGPGARVIRIVTMIRMDIAAIQTALREQGLDAWLFYDHHGRDPIAYRILGLDITAHVTRRWYYLVPAVGEPQKLVHRIEQARLDTLPGAKHRYSSWQEHEGLLAAMLAPHTRIAMQYSPRNAIM